MNFGIDGSGFGAGGFIILMMLAALAFGMIRYNNFTRPQNEREVDDAHDAEVREHRAAHELDVPTAEEDRI